MLHTSVVLSAHAGLFTAERSASQSFVQHVRATAVIYVSQRLVQVISLLHYFPAVHYRT